MGPREHGQGLEVQSAVGLLRIGRSPPSARPARAPTTQGREGGEGGGGGVWTPKKSVCNLLHRGYWVLKGFLLTYTLGAHGTDMGGGGGLTTR